MFHEDASSVAGSTGPLYARPRLLALDVGIRRGIDAIQKIALRGRERDRADLLDHDGARWYDGAQPDEIEIGDAGGKQSRVEGSEQGGTRPDSGPDGDQQT